MARVRGSGRQIGGAALPVRPAGTTQTLAELHLDDDTAAVAQSQAVHAPDARVEELTAFESGTADAVAESVECRRHCGRLDVVKHLVHDARDLTPADEALSDHIGGLRHKVGAYVHLFAPLRADTGWR